MKNPILLRVVLFVITTKEKKIKALFLRIVFRPVNYVDNGDKKTRSF